MGIGRGEDDDGVMTASVTPISTTVAVPATKHHALPIRIVVADDHPLFREGIVRALREDGRFDVVGEAGDGIAALHHIERLEPDVALLDVRMPWVDGPTVLRQIASSPLGVVVILLSAFHDQAVVKSALDGGAAAYLTKDADREDIIEAIVFAVSGASHGPATGERHGDAPWPPALTLRERQVLGLTNAGWEPAEIEMLLGLDPAGVQEHVRSAQRALMAADLQEAIAGALLWGLIR
jgi:two-component system nitrate/nitrite response regulator NarL